MMRKMLFIVFALCLFGAAHAADRVCEEHDTHQLFWYIVEPSLTSATLATQDNQEKWVRTQVRIELNRLHEIVNDEDDQALRAYFSDTGRPDVAAWITERGGYKFIAARILCFKQHYVAMLSGNCGLVATYLADAEHKFFPVTHVKNRFTALSQSAY